MNRPAGGDTAAASLSPQATIEDALRCWIRRHLGVTSAPTSQNAARLGVGADLPVSSKISLYASYDADVGASSTAQYLTGGLRVIW